MIMVWHFRPGWRGMRFFKASPTTVQLLLSLIVPPTERHR